VLVDQLTTVQAVSVPRPAVIGRSTSTLGCLVSADSAVTDTVEDFLRDAVTAVTAAATPNIERRFVGECCTSTSQHSSSDFTRKHVDAEC